MITQATASVVSTETPVRSSRFALNLISNVGKLGLTMLVGIWYVPFLVRHLGPAAYGLIPLTSTITSYMGVFTLSLNFAVARYLAISLENGDDREANKVFNAAFWGNAVIALLLLIPAAVAIVALPHLVRIPPGAVNAARYLFGGAVAAFFLNQIKSPFLTSCFCLNRLDLQNIVTVGETLVRVGSVAVLFFVFSPRIEYVGAAVVAGAIVSVFGSVAAWRTLTPNLRVHPGDFNWSMMEALCSTGGWVVVSQVGILLYQNIDLVLANRLFGPDQCGRYAAVLQLATLLSTLGMAIGEIFAPTMYQKFARGNIDDLAQYLNGAIKFLGLIMALVVGLICGFSKPLLLLWLGPTFGNMAPLLFLLAIHLAINLATYPLYSVPLAANRVKVPGLVTLGIGVFNLVLALVLTLICGWGLYGLALAGAISLTLRRFVFTPLYVAAILGQPRFTYFKKMGTIIGATLATVGICWCISLKWSLTNWMNLVIAVAAVTFLFAAATYLLISVEERAALKKAIVQWRQ